MTNFDELEPLARDVSPREYFRGNDGGQSFILMRYPQVTEEHRAELHNFIHIGKWLADNGIKTPDLYDLDGDACIAKFEDLGRTSFGAHLRGNSSVGEEVYSLAVDVLKELGRAGVPDNLPAYNDSRIHKNHRQIIDYYLPLIGGRAKHMSSRAQLRDLKISPLPLVGRDDSGCSKLIDEYLAVWDEIESSLPPCPMGFVHGDYHLENLMYMDGGAGIKQCALIDYQDALHGGLPYDLVNLLEDARVDVPEDLRTRMIDRYCEGMSRAQKDAFLKWYRVLGTQFHCRVIGLFIMLAAEQGRDDYLIHINRLQKYIEIALEDNLLLPLKVWLKKEMVDFNPIKDLNGGMVRSIFET